MLRKALAKQDGILDETDYDRNPLHHAVDVDYSGFSGADNSPEALKKLEQIVDMLSQAGANVHGENSFGSTVIADMNSLFVLKYLIRFYYKKH